MAESQVKKAKGAPIVKLGQTGNKHHGRDEKVQGVIPPAYEQSAG